MIVLVLVIMILIQNNANPGGNCSESGVEAHPRFGAVHPGFEVHLGLGAVHLGPCGTILLWIHKLYYVTLN